MLKLYNTLTRRLETFTPIDAHVAKIYSCGPTVYRYIHIGNLRTFLMADWLRRVLLYHGYHVQHIKNITDVGHMRVERLDQGEDKMLAQARKEGKTSREIAAFYTAAFHADEAHMNILPADVFPRATDHISEMIDIVQGLERKGLAYNVDGNVFFDVHRFPAYGQLSGNELAQLMEGVRDKMVDTQRRNPEDFPLWKVAEPNREMAWDSPWGHGFPGWHIECSAMSMKYLGSHFDIHTGGVDNIFPHHEGERAQSEGFSGETFVNYWVHAQHLLADGLKMAKSTGNVYMLSDIEARGFDPMALRYLFATVHYRSRNNFTFGALRAAQIGLRRMRLALLRLVARADAAGLDRHARLEAHAANRDDLSEAGAQWQQRFVAAIDNNLNMPQALATAWDVLRGRGPQVASTEALALLLDWDNVLGLRLHEFLDEALQPALDMAGREALTFGRTTVELPDAIATLVQRRAALRNEGRYAEADALREHIHAAGYTVRDTSGGSVAERRAAEKEFTTISHATDVPDMREEPDAHAFSVNLLARDSRADLERCVNSIARQRHGKDIEIVIVDNGSSDDTLPYLQQLARNGLHDEAGQPLPLTVLFADHNMGFAAGRNATMRASRGRITVLIDTSIELQGNIWTPIEQALADETVGVVGPYGLVTEDLKEFQESAGPQVDAVEGYMMAFRRELLHEIGWFDEKFRFYRLLDIHTSFFIKAAGYSVVVVPEIAARIEKHPHREWYSLTEEEQAARSKKNYDIFRRRWHHGENLLMMNYCAEDRWFGHDHPNHLGGTHTHAPEELPPPGQPHTHIHQHWPDHAHEHGHYH
jgi:cysteinyl-tRNA synthetase